MHTIVRKAELLNEVRRAIGELQRVERALTEEPERGKVLQLLACVRGSVGTLLGKLLDEDIRSHLVSEEGESSEQRQRDAEDVITVVRAYLK